MTPIPLCEKTFSTSGQRECVESTQRKDRQRAGKIWSLFSLARSFRWYFNNYLDNDISQVTLIIVNYTISSRAY